MIVSTPNIPKLPLDLHTYIQVRIDSDQSRQRHLSVGSGGDKSKKVLVISGDKHTA